MMFPSFFGGVFTTVTSSVMNSLTQHEYILIQEAAINPLEHLLKNKTKNCHVCIISFSQVYQSNSLVTLV